MLQNLLIRNAIIFISAFKEKGVCTLRGRNEERKEEGKWGIKEGGKKGGREGRRKLPHTANSYYVPSTCPGSLRENCGQHLRETGAADDMPTFPCWKSQAKMWNQTRLVPTLTSDTW